jgi:hypothetical protein
MTLAEFLLARITEDEAVARSVEPDDRHGYERVDDHAGYVILSVDPTRVLAECEAKRRIVERFKWAAENPDLYRNDMELMDQWGDAMDTLTDAAAAHADHPDYRDEWKP